MLAPLLTPAQRTRHPSRVARVCMNGHLADADLAPSIAADVATNRADPLSVRTTSVSCGTCGAGTIVGCPCCGFPIPGKTPPLAYDVPHFCVVCGEYYPWTFRGEFYTTLADILEESELAHVDVAAALRSLDRQREGLATRAEIDSLTATFRSLGGSDWDLAAQILSVVLPAADREGLDLAAAFVH
jgi:hypothetical protein